MAEDFVIEKTIPPLVVTTTLPLDQNPAAIYLATLRPSGRRSMLHALTVMAEMAHHGSTALTLPWHELRYQHTVAIAMALREKGYRPATINRSLAALRGVLKQAWNLGLMTSEQYHRAINLKGVRSDTLLRGRALKNKELEALMTACRADKGNAGKRDIALIAITYFSGLRRSEVVFLNVADYDHESGAITIREGKGGKDRTTYAGNGVDNLLTEWLAVRGNQPGPLFVSINKGGKLNLGHRMTAQAVLHILAKRGKEAGLQAFSPHDLRRTFISDLLDAGADIVTVQKLAGHANVTTTARYDRRGEATKKKAAALLQIPSIK
ncbi:MAG: site-specific integrase [Chloroflexota bacterium]